jgi:hypothetical protein
VLDQKSRALTLAAFSFVNNIVLFEIYYISLECTASLWVVITQCLRLIISH